MHWCDGGMARLGWHGLGAVAIFPQGITPPKRKVPRKLCFLCHHKTGVPEQHSNSVNFTLIVQKCGVGAVNAGALRPSSPAARHGGRRGQLGLVHPFPRERGATGLSACAVRGQEEGWGQRWRALADGAAWPNGKGRGQGRRGEGAACGPPPFHANAEGVKGRGVACGAPLFCVNAKGLGQGWRALAYGGLSQGTGQWRRGEGAACPWCAPLPRKRGREGLGVVCPCVPLYAAEGEREGPGARGEGAASPLPQEWGRMAAGCPRVNGKGGARKRGRGWWRGALMCTPSVRMGGADRGRVGGEGEGRRDVGEGCALVRSLSVRTGWRRLGDKEGAACPHALPLSTREGVADSAGGGRGGELPWCTPFLRSNGAAVNAGGEDEGATYPGAPLSARKRVGPPMSPLLPLLSSQPPHSREKGTQAEVPASHTEREHQDKGRTMPATPRPPGPSLLPIRTTTFAQGHAAAAAASPVRGTPFARKGGARGLTPCPSSSYLATPVHMEREHATPRPFPSLCVEGGRMGALRPTTPHWPWPFPLGVCEGRSPHLSTLAPPPSRPVPLVRATPFVRSEGVRGQEHAERGHARACDPPASPSSFVWKGGVQGHTAPPLRVAPTLFPFPLCATLFAQKGGMRPPQPFPSPFTRKGGAQHRPIHAGRGARGQADPASLCVTQRGRTVSRKRDFLGTFLFGGVIPCGKMATVGGLGRDMGDNE
ncbi:hypothetical protein EDB85DRAFT_1887613 [Lactarius pseudohatsudake]|nr:hypothetical protein EDB85DRAFT_1887613 [Lactarius pseudohatsudake]